MNTRARWSPSPTTGTSSTTSPSWILELDRGRGVPFSGNYSGWLEQKLERMARESKVLPTRGSAPSPASSSGCGLGARARQAKRQARLTAYGRLLTEANDAKDTSR